MCHAQHFAINSQGYNFGLIGPVSRNQSVKISSLDNCILRVKDQYFKFYICLCLFLSICWSVQILSGAISPARIDSIYFYLQMSFTYSMYMKCPHHFQQVLRSRSYFCASYIILFMGNIFSISFVRIGQILYTFI